MNSVTREVQIFLSHTKLDEKCCDKFDSVAARIGLRVFRSEFENLESPAWKTIKSEINRSSALFLLVGQELVKAQEASRYEKDTGESWRHTQNWISYEVGVACQLGIDVWVVCDSVNINFPVPYLNNYDIWGIRREMQGSMGFFKWVFSNYKDGSIFAVGRFAEKIFKCPHCGAIFNLYSELPKKMETPCPTCLGNLNFAEGWLLRTGH